MLIIINQWITIVQRDRCTDGAQNCDIFLWQTHQNRVVIFDATVNKKFSIIFQNFIYLHDNEM